MTRARTTTSTVQTASARYEVAVGAGVLPELGARLRAALMRPAGRTLMVVDSGIAADASNAAEQSLRREGFAVHMVTFAPSEDAKSLASLEVLLRAAADAELDRGDVAVALGGGIVGDLAGFAAASYKRGIAIAQCPSTLLAMVDASVGGKTGVNLRSRAGLLKNMAGAFHQPSIVLADVDLLATLPAREFRSGLAECLKHGLLSAEFGDADLWRWTLGAMERIIAQDPETLVELITRNIRVKARIVGNDEREMLPSAGRALLNLGHTFGHAIETWPGARPSGGGEGLLHGEAVGAGLVAAAECAAAMGLCPRALADDVAEALTKAGLPRVIEGLPRDDMLFERLRHDKKTSGGVLRLILPRGDGRAEVRTDVPQEVIYKGLAAIRG